MSSLNEIDVATPLNGATPQELLEEVRALKRVLKTVLLTSLNPNGTVRDGAISGLPEGSVGTSSISQASVTSEKIAEGAVEASQLSSFSVTETKIAPGAVTELKYGDASIPGTAYKPNTIPIDSLAGYITDAYLSSSGSVDADRAVGVDHLKDNSVTDRAVADVAVGKLTGGADANFLFKVAGVWTGVAAAGALTYNALTGLFDVSSGITAATVGDAKARGAAGGVATAGAWNLRTLGELADPFNLVTFASSAFSLVVGKYLIYLKCPATGVGKHQARLMQTSDTATPLLWGSSAIASGAGVQSESIICGLIEVTDAEAVYEVQHYIENTVGTSDLGAPASSDNTTPYANHREVYTIGYFVKIG